MSHSKLERRLYTLAAHELAAARQQLVLLGRKTASERLASFILDLGNRQRKSGSDDPVVELPMSRTDIADYLGLRIETVSREFTLLKTTGLIRLLGTHELRILDRPGLEALSEG